MNEQTTTRGGDSPTFRPQLAIPRSLYIHIPFCRHRCGYCNFTLVAGRDYLIERFLVALETEISWLDATHQVETVFLGGGTPSHLSPTQLDRLSSIIRSKFVMVDDAEVTAECNPNDLNVDRMAALARLGVNRISLGAQSLNPEKLKRLERDHLPNEVRNAVEVARQYAAQVSIDLIFAAPHETLLDWETDLAAAMQLTPDHMSTYELTYEKGTRFWNELRRGGLNESDEDLRGDMYALAMERLEQADFHQYEISSFAKKNHRCRHNLAYWIGDPYFAFGPGASRFVDGIRETNHQSTMQYLKLVEENRSPVADHEQLDQIAAAKERLAIGLRMVAGLKETDFERRTGVSIPEVLGSLRHSLIEHRLLQCSNGNWRLTRRGMMLGDWIAGEIVGQA